MTFNKQDSMSTSTVTVSPTILCVDDEPNILSALRRLLRPHGYRVLTADSGAAGLALLESEAVDLVISDMRMPRMDGAQFLAQVCRRWPGTMRLLLTGYADIPSILDAINQGEIYRYLTKPWDESDIVLVVRHALERRALEQDKLRLEALTASQNLQLKVLNASLEEKVAQRTRQLKLSHDEVLAANDKLKATFVTTIKVFSNLIEMRGGKLAGHARRVAELSRKLALALGLEAQEARDVFIAALLKDIGKLSLSDELLELPASAWSGEQLAAFRKHPLRAEQLLMALDELRAVSVILRSQLERFDGGGFPDGLIGLAIPLGARILALACDYDGLQIGAMVQRNLRADEARALIYDSAGKRYDPLVVDAFRAIMDQTEPPPRDLAVPSGQLEPGMVLSRDLISRDGLMLLAAEHVLTARMIAQLLDFEGKNGGKLSIRVYPPARSG
ncbi:MULTISPECIES: HD domain-containing phosphohydrolase [unclassified Janthinobacterium]|uniref:HD domain-containing phosphohydrolase n=1 Tax=unclassified Janthinobacterium TaxID=2610881 RepID=UPI00161B5136|nr:MULTISPECIES: HD domain-containing phosphohydrolase [unclassified Janthinobacterium]MBB5607030.1 response regulator RpfG family c-di-GMP phosphodiesterase [Janthinobacterium sp. S3T4]MBB5612756.1 response regulator RpfG family c-di-GMP phosphodiesterase [Janthinobacterium sp. S3M3]